MTTAAAALPGSEEALEPAHRAPDVPGRGTGTWLSRRPLLRCLVIYRQMPGLFVTTFALFFAVNVGLAVQQHLVGRAVHDVEQGRAVTRTAEGALDLSVGLRWAFVLLAVAVVRAALQYAAGLLSLTAGQELLLRLRMAILVQVQRLDLAYHVRHGVGEMVTRTTRDADKVRDALISFWRNIVETSLIVAGAIGLIALYAPVLAIGPIAAIAVGIVWILGHTRPLVQLDREAGAAFDAVNQDLAEGVHGVRVVKAFALERDRIARFEGAVHTFVGRARTALRYASAQMPTPQIIVAMGQVWVLVVGVHLVQRGRLDIGALVAALLVMNTVVFRIETIGRVLQVFADARSSAARMMDLIDAEPGIRGGRDRLPPGPLGFDLRDVHVRAPGGDTEVLAGVSLRADPGEIVALVGATGAGKSTLTGLLPRLVDPETGTVKVGSDRLGWFDLRTLDTSGLRRRVHVVPQETFLFSDTIGKNLRIGAPHASDEEVWIALAAAAAEEIVRALPEGLDTVVGDRGVTLSGGQRQRLALARAFVARPDLLVLDDATSALDAVTERRILEAIRSLRSAGGAPPTVLLVASKLSTVRLADRAAVLSAGRIVADDRPEILGAQNLPFRELLGISDATQRT